MRSHISRIIRLVAWTPARPTRPLIISCECQLWYDSGQMIACLRRMVPVLLVHLRGSGWLSMSTVIQRGGDRPDKIQLHFVLCSDRSYRLTSLKFAATWSAQRRTHRVFWNILSKYTFRNWVESGGHTRLDLKLANMYMTQASNAWVHRDGVSLFHGASRGVVMIFYATKTKRIRRSSNK